MSVKTHLFVFDGIIEVYLLTTESTYSRIHTKLRSPLLIRPACWYVPATGYNTINLPQTATYSKDDLRKEIRNCFVHLNYKDDLSVREDIHGLIFHI